MITISSLHARSTQRNLIHGDFCERHVLVSRNGSLEGVIDWGRARLSNPSKDLEFIHSFFPKNQHEEFFKHYGDVSDATWQQALLSSMHSSLILVEHAVTHNIKHIYKSTFQALNFVLENPTDI